MSIDSDNYVQKSQFIRWRAIHRLAQRFRQNRNGFTCRGYRNGRFDRVRVEERPQPDIVSELIPRSQKTQRQNQPEEQAECDCRGQPLVVIETVR